MPVTKSAAESGGRLGSVCRSHPDIDGALSVPSLNFYKVHKRWRSDLNERQGVDTQAFEQSRHDRKPVEMLFAHLKRILPLGRLQLRGPCGAQDELTLGAIAQDL